MGRSFATHNMNYSDNSRDELLAELKAARKRIADLEQLKLTQGELEKPSTAIERPFRPFFEGHDAVMLLVEPETGEIVDVNKAAAKFYGYGRDQLLSMRISDINRLQPAEVAEECERARREERNYYVFPHHLANGTIKTVEVHASPIEMHGRWLLFSIIHDVSQQIWVSEELDRYREDLERVVSERTTELEKMNKQLTMAMDLARLVRWEFNLETNMFTFDDHFYGFYGTTSEQEGGLLMSAKGYMKRFVHPDDAGIFVKERAKMVAAKDPDYLGYLEYRIIRANGQIRFISVRYRIVKDEEGIATRSYGVGQDITERREREEQLRQKTALLEAQVNASLDGIMIVDKGENILHNDRFIDMWKIPRDIIVGKNGEKRIRWIAAMAEDSERFYEGVMHLYAHPSETCRDEIVLKDGRVLDRYSSPVIGKNGEHYGRIWNFRDITGRKIMEESIRESEAKYRIVVENSLVGFFIVQDGLFRYVNKRFCEIFGYPHEGVVDKLGPMDLAHPDDRENVAENIRKRLSGEADYIEYDFRGLKNGGKLVSLRVLGGIMPFKGRLAAIGTIIDLSKERTLEAQLRQAQKMEAIGTLAGGIAHDFNNLLTVLTGYATLLQMKTEKDNPLRIYVDQILTASQKAANLTQSLLSFSRKQPISLIPLNLNNLIKNAEGILKRLLTEDIVLKTNLSSQDLVILADATQIDQVMFNLATNARDAMKKGGVLTIETKHAYLDDEFARISRFGVQGEYALLSVSDTGCGMDDATKEKIFDPFFTTKDTGKGTGLGLSTVYGIVTQHNGHIHVYSIQGRGSTFDIYFPAAQQNASEKALALEEIRGGTETLLIAEDNEQLRCLIKEVATKKGYSLIEAVDGEDAVNKFMKHRDEIDLALFDVVMPKKNGKEAYEEIRKMRPDLKVLFVSGYTRDVVLDKGVNDAVDFVSKPILPYELLHKLRDILDR